MCVRLVTARNFCGLAGRTSYRQDVRFSRSHWEQRRLSEAASLLESLKSKTTKLAGPDAAPGLEQRKDAGRQYDREDGSSQNDFHVDFKMMSWRRASNRFTEGLVHAPSSWSRIIFCLVFGFPLRPGRSSAAFRLTGETGLRSDTCSIVQNSSGSRVRVEFPPADRGEHIQRSINLGRCYRQTLEPQEWNRCEHR
jgi:hypothetical protein